MTFPSMTRSIRSSLIVVLLATSAGCSLPQSTPLPTPWPPDYLPTVVAMTAQALATATPAIASPAGTGTSTATVTETPTPSETPTLPAIAPTYLYFLTRTVTPTPSVGRAQIEIYAPGPMSKVVSPIKVRSYLSVNAVGTTRVELFGEDGRLLTRIVKHTKSEYFQYDRLAVDVPYKITGAAELGRLQISTEDRYGLTKDLVSVHVLLLSDGNDQITATGILPEPCLLLAPEPAAQVSGGNLDIRGKMRTINTLPVFFELIEPSGAVLGSKVFAFGAADGTYRNFSISMPYSVSSQTEAYLVVRQSDDRIQGPAYLYRQPITLTP